MSDMYQYPVFFECDSLGTEHFKKIQKYFRIRRKSGGGDCGPLKRVADQIYCVAFKYEKDQQTVLQRSKHDVEGLVFTVRGSLETRTSSPGSKSPPFISASTSPPSGETCELQLDSYLLRYLKECPKAEKELERKLRSVPCSAQLYPEDGRVLVRSLTQPGAVDEVRDLKADVHKIFDGYQCHYEMDNRKIKALLKSCSSDQTTDEVKVYSEVGMAVVVGELSQVNARLMEIEQGPGLSEKQSIYQLGEAKLRLLWREIKYRLAQECPGVKVTKGDAGQLLLQGCVEDICKAGDWISEKESLVLERKVSDLSPHALAILKKAYGEPGELGDFLQVGVKVEMELRDTELCLFALSADILDNTEKTLRDEIKEVSVDVPNCSTVPSELREKLKSKTSELNREQYRAEVVFGSGNTLCLLGCTKDVEELREIITQFILVKSNPSSKVTDFSNSHDPFGQDSVTFDPSGEVKYARSPTGKDETPSFNNLASLSLSDTNATVASYNLSEGLQVLVCHGDITKLGADALVNAANEDLDHGGGVAQALSKAGGPQVQQESKDLVKRCGKIPTGEVVVTTGGNLNCKALLHAVGPAAGTAGEGARVLLEKNVQSTLNLAERMKFQSVAMPCISSGSFGVPVNVCSEAIVTAVKRFGSQGGRSLSRITLIDNREEVVRAMQEACERLLHRTSRENSSPRNLEFQVDAAAHSSSRDTDAGAPGDGVRVKIIIGTIETQQVDAVVSPMVGHDPLSTRIGNTLYERVGPRLTSRFREEAGEETQPGDTVLVEGLPKLLSNSVFFLNLLPWNDDEDGVAVQVLRLGISNILTSCENRGFTSVALPLLGSGIALGFPDSVVDRVLHEEILKFEQSRDNRTSLWVCIVIHPNDGEFCEEPFQPKRLSEDDDQSFQESTTKRIILLGKTGAGKSNLANTIFGEKLFTKNHSPNSETSKCHAETRSVNGRSITLIDTPGFFDVNRSEEDMKPEIVRCITECAPGPHAFLIVLKVEKFTEHERAVVTKICEYFSEDALKYAVIVFTHGDQLPKGMTIEEFVSQNENLSDLVKKCGGRCHVFDNKYWKNKMQTNYRSNQLQVEDLLKTIDKMVMGNNGDYYNNEMLQVVEKEIQKEEEQIRKSSGNMPVTEIRKQAKTRVSERFLISLAGTATGALLGAFFGVAAMVGFAITALRNSAALLRLLKRLPALGGAAAGAAGGSEVAGLAAAGVVVGVTTAGAATAGGVMGGVIGHDAAKEAETPLEAVEKAASAVLNKGRDFLKLP